MTIILMVLMMCVLVVPHEFGHFITAKACGVQVNEFSVGIGPLIYQRQRGETKYSIRLVPFGGYCAMEGEDEESENPRAFNNQSTLHKILIVSAGAIMNILIAIVIVSAIITYSGYATNTIGTVSDNSPAAEAGIMAGDTIIAIDGKDVDSWADVIAGIDDAKEDTPIHLSIRRDGEDIDYDVVPAPEDDGRLIIGITTKPSHNVFVCTWYGMQTTWQLNKSILNSFVQLFTHGVGKDDVAGPVGMAQVVSQTVKVGYINYIYLIAIVSINLAVLNLLPFPALDGGRLLMIIIRRITGNVITDNIEGYIHAFGMIVLLGFFVFVTWNDIMRILFK